MAATSASGSGAATPSPAAARNPWPCARCGAPIRIAPHAGHLPAGALAAAAAVVLLLGLGVWRLQPSLVSDWLLSMLAALLLVVLAVHRRSRRAWICSRCKNESPARLRPAGPPSFVVAIPTYNNAASIASVIAGVRQAVPQLPLIVVDDGSTDATADAIRQAIGEDDQTELLQHRTNRGKGAALRTALERAWAAGYSHLVSLDGDGQHLATELPQLLDAARAAPSALVLGDRNLEADHVESVSRFGRRFSNFWLWALSGRRVADSQCGMRVYPTAPTLSLGPRGRRFDFEVEILVLAARAGIPLVSIPVSVHYPPATERVSHFHKGWDNARISWVNIRLLAGIWLWPLGWPARLSRETPPAAVLRDWSGQDRGGALGHQIFFWIIKLVGPAPAYWVLYPVALYFMFAARDIVRPSQAFLDRVLGPATGGWQRFWRSYRHVLTFARCILDRAVGLALGPSAFQWTSEGEDNVVDHVHSGHGAIFLSAHVGNYELAATCGGSTYDFPINVVMVDVEADAVKEVYRRAAGNHREPKIIATNRAEFPALQILHALRDHEVVAMHGDRVIDPNWVWCDFLGGKAPFPTGAFQMAAAAKVPIVLTMGLRTGSRRYRFVAEPPRHIELPRTGRQEALAAQAQWYADCVASYVRQYPYQWFNYFDFWQPPAAASSSTGSMDATEPP